MINGIIGEKLGMTQIYENGVITSVTIIEGGPCKIVQKKNIEKDGYEAVQVAYKEIKERKINKPLMGHFKKSKIAPSKILKEMKSDGNGDIVGQTINLDIFEKGEKVDVIGVSKGKGFAGVVKRYHFKGGPGSHGSMFHRAPGSIGSSSFPSRVFKNKKLPGHMGSRRVTVKGLMIADIRKEQNLLFIKGAVPGANGSIIVIRKIKGNN